MQKIIELKNVDWVKGISAQPNLAVGGLLQALTGCDPFEQSGTALPSLTPATISVATTPKAINNFNNASTAYVYVHTATKLYQVLKDSPYTITDVTSSITVNTCNNAILFDSLYVYAGTDFRFNASVPVGGTDTQIAAGFNGTMDFNALCIGADKNLYVGQNSRIGEFSVTAHAWTATAFQIDGNFNVRDMVNDGRYLVIIADNNAATLSGRQVGNYRCRVYFWDMVKGTADIIYDINDSYLIAAKFLDGGIYIFGYKGLYICNSATAPKMIRPFVGSSALTVAKPLSPAQVTVSNGSIYWVDGGTNTLLKHNVYAYGNPITSGSDTKSGRKIFYTPYLDTGADMTQTVLSVVGDQFWVGGDTPVIYVHNIGSTRGSMTVTTLNTDMTKPHKFGFTKVVLGAPLTTGQTVIHSATSGGGSVTVSANETKSFVIGQSKQSFIFKRTATAGAVEQFEDLTATVRTTGGAPIQRITVYASPSDDSNEIV